jgi:hypothetical protein
MVRSGNGKLLTRNVKEVFHCHVLRISSKDSVSIQPRLVLLLLKLQEITHTQI